MNHETGTSEIHHLLDAFHHEIAPATEAPTGQNIPAQGNALGSTAKNNPSPEGAEQRL